MNLCCFSGHLAADVELRYSKDGTAIASFRIGVSCGYGDHKRTEWVSCVAFKKTAEVAGQYLQKGGKVLVETELQTEKWKDKDGNDRYGQKYIVRNLEFLSGKKDDAGQDRKTNFPPPAGGGGAYTGDEVPFSPSF